MDLYQDYLTGATSQVDEQASLYVESSVQGVILLIAVSPGFPVGDFYRENIYIYLLFV